MQLKRAALYGLRIVGAVVALVALTVGVMLVTLRTDWGGERLRRQVVLRVNQQIQGHLDIGRLAFGGDRITVWNLMLRDPDGREVARVARTQVAFSVMRLLHKEVRVTAFAIEGPRLGLVSGPRGSNLARAVAPRKKAPPSPRPRTRTTSEGWVILLDRFDLSDGDVTMAMAVGAQPLTAAADEVAATRAHLAALSSFAHVRYATGNGSLDLRFRIQGESLLAPAGPLRLSADATIRGDVTRLGIDGALLGGTIKVRGDVDRAHLENADALIAIAIPAVGLQGHGWGPLRIDGEAHPGSIPKLDLSMVIPGVVLTGKGGRGPDQADHKANQPGDSPRFDFQARLALTDLALTARAAQAFTGGTLAPLSGHGQIDLGFGGPLTQVPASWRGHIAGGIDHLRFAGTVIDGLTIDGRTAHLSSRPEDATLDVAVGAVRAGATVLHDLKLGAKARGRELTAEVTVAAPHAVRLTLAARIDEDRQGLALERLALTYPEGSWATDGVARLELGGGRLSLTSFRLLSRGQTLVIDGARSGDELDAHVALHDVRLALLPAFLVDPRLRLGGILDADVKADGNTDNPRVVARAQLQDARYQGFSRIGITVAATLADRHVDGTLNVDAPFVAIDAGFKLPTDALAPGAPLDLRLDVKRLRIAELLRGAAMEPQGDGRITAQLRLTGSADDPHVDLTATGKDLKINRPALAASRRAAATAARSHASAASPDANETTDLGHLSLHVTYAQRRAHADLDFASAHGGTLTVDAGAQVDLSYPLATHKLVVNRIPVHGKVVARNLDVAWIAQFNDRVESLGGEVNANAKLAGTVGDPQFIGDVRWKNGKIVATGTEGTSRR